MDAATVVGLVGASVRPFVGCNSTCVVRVRACLHPSWSTRVKQVVGRLFVRKRTFEKCPPVVESVKCRIRFLIHSARATKKAALSRLLPLYLPSVGYFDLGSDGGLMYSP